MSCEHVTLQAAVAPSLPPSLSTCCGYLDLLFREHAIPGDLNLCFLSPLRACSACITRMIDSPPSGGTKCSTSQCSAVSTSHSHRFNDLLESVEHANVHYDGVSGVPYGWWMVPRRPQSLLPGSAQLTSVNLAVPLFTAGCRSNYFFL